MKQIVVVTMVLAVLGVACVGCLYIFEILSYTEAMSNLLKVEAAIILLGGCSALIAYVMGTRKAPPN